MRNSTSIIPEVNREMKTKDGSERRFFPSFFPFCNRPESGNVQSTTKSSEKGQRTKIRCSCVTTERSGSSPCHARNTSRHFSPIQVSSTTFEWFALKLNFLHGLCNVCRVTQGCYIDWERPLDDGWRRSRKSKIETRGGFISTGDAQIR